MLEKTAERERISGTEEVGRHLRRQGSGISVWRLNKDLEKAQVQVRDSLQAGEREMSQEVKILKEDKSWSK
jgi:hypothetical protein